MQSYSYPYQTLYDCKDFKGTIRVVDHLDGFDSTLKNSILQHIQDYANGNVIVESNYVIADNIRSEYPALKLQWIDTIVNSCFREYHTHPEIQYKNFLCSFNGTDHVSRKLLVAILERFKYFNPEYCSKNMEFTVDKLDGHITNYVKDLDCFYRKFFISSHSDKFFNTVNSFGHVRFDHTQNIYNLESKLTGSFLHLVSETMATSYYPFVTEKFLYSIVTRGLFLAYAQPGWHNHVEKYYGFKKYNQLFDYQFDSINNPVIRLIELMTMLSKFSVLSPSDWADLYLLEQDTIEYNYNHYMSGDYLKKLKCYDL